MGGRGYKTRIDALESKSKKNFDADKEIDMDCNGWRENPSLFKPPSNITFTDSTQAMQQIQQTTGDMQKMKCQACDQVPAGPGRDQCRQMMGC